MEVVWVDNPRTTSAKIEASLGVDLVLNDPLHALMLVSRTVPDDHCLKGMMSVLGSQVISMHPFGLVELQQTIRPFGFCSWQASCPRGNCDQPRLVRGWLVVG